MSRRLAKSGRRRGAVLIVVLVAAMIVMLMIGAWFRLAVVQQQEFRRAEDRAQACWLAEAGLARAQARLAADAGYAGEVWTLGLEDLGLDASTSGIVAGGETEPVARVTIRLEPPADGEKDKHFAATAEYPTRPAQRQQRVSRRAAVAVNKPSETGDAP